MKLVISDTDSHASLEIARNVITQWLATTGKAIPPKPATPVTETKVSGTINTPPPEPQPLGPALSDPTEASNQPSPEKRGPGRPRKTADVKVAKTYTLDQVRARMLDLLKERGDGMMNAQRELLHAFGASNISTLPIERLAEFMAKLEAL